jgi:phosphoenolpyruvate synthase/pyruvate phosphate dikinase
MSNNGSSPLVLWYNQLGMNDVDRVGGKNASLGEMITNLSGMGVSVPNGFATTADAFNQFLDQSGETSASMTCWIKRTLTTFPSWRKRRADPPVDSRYPVPAGV